MSLKRPLITIGMPVFNGEQYINEAIQSILDQSIKDFELIISDNASTDSTTEICRRYATLDSRIRYARQIKNIGAPRNWNYVFNQSSGIYFKWASANDICKHRMLEVCLEVLEEQKDVVLSYPKTKIIDSKSDMEIEYKDSFDLQEASAVKRFKKFLNRIDLNNLQNGLIRSEALRKTALEGVYENSDIALMAELALYGKFVEIPEFLFNRRIVQGAATCLRSSLEKRQFNVPNFQGKIYLPILQLYLSFFSAVFRSPIKVHEKVNLYYYLCKRISWDRKYMLENISKCMQLRGSRNTQNISE